ncbi:MAG: hypothetical protein HY894_08915 [Deltaproteobacteria bacterium]|nr:hypothetical protein [Deltaproteobacteria bacterium]
MGTMPSGAERLQLYDAMCKAGLETGSGRPWTLDPGRLRFKHGVSLAELKVPYHMGGEDEACVQNAVMSLLTLLMKRYEYGGPERRDLAAVRLPMPGFSPAVKDRSFRTDIFIADSVEKKTAQTALACVPNIDSALLTVWLGGEGHGRKFIKWINDIFDKALKDEARSGWTEPTSYLVLLAVMNAVHGKKEGIKEFRIKGLAYEKAELSVGLALWAALRCGLADLFGRLKEGRASYYNPGVEMTLMSALTPRPFVSITANLMASGPNPYGISAETYEILLPYTVPFSDTHATADDMLDFIHRHIEDNKDVMEAVRRQYETTRLRSEILNYLREVDLPGAKAHDELFGIYNEDRHAARFLADPRLSVELGLGLDEVKTQLTRDARRVEAVAAFQKFLSSYKKSAFSSFLKGKKTGAEEMIKDVIGRACSARFDAHADGFVALMRAYTADRRAEFDAGTLLDEYTRGRLYRFSSDERPILKSLSLEEEGQLFIDMKDFTRKTLKVKEIAMADFMKEHFYAPILNAASRYSAGSMHAAEESGIRLTNMPGDAAIFSGGVTNLVSLARDMQRIINGYRQQLQKRLPPDGAIGALEGAHHAFEAARAGLKTRRDELMRSLDRKEQGVEARLAALGEEEHRLENGYRDELEAAVKNELEAGLYISYGTKAESAIIDAKETFAGAVKVAIGEKINEAARGTSRNSMVRAKLEMLLEQERLKRNSMGLRYAFDIYIDRIYSVKMPPELDAAFERLATQKKPTAAEAMARIMANEFMGDLRKVVKGEPFSNLRLITAATDIYNKGQAISANALSAYMRERRGVRKFFKKTVKMAGLSDYLQENFFFPSEPMEFIFGYEVVKGADEIEGFRRAGEVTFKGFEAGKPTAVYEILNAEGPFFRALVKQHFQDWLAEAGRRGQEEVGGGGRGGAGLQP